jgi:hypothetical protein
MTEWITRAQIGLRPRNGGGVALKVANVDGYALHWPGMAKPIDATGDAGFRRVCSALRGWQAYHMDTRGWSDIAYQAAVDQAGRKYSLRGLNIQSGANGDQDVNVRFGAILLVLAPGEKPSAAMIATAKEVAGEFCRRFTGARKKPYGHQDVRPRNSSGEKTTDCPGPAAEAAINAGTFTPGTTTPTEDTLSQAEVQQITTAIAAMETDLKTGIDGVAARLESSVKSAVEAAGRRWALYEILYGLETEDDRERAREAYRSARTAGKTEEEAMAAAEAELSTLRQQIKEAQANG